MVGGTYKMHINKINIEIQACNCHFNNSIEAKKLETKNVLVDQKNIRTCGKVKHKLRIASNEF